MYICAFVISLGTYVFSISGEYMTSSGVTYYGMYDNRLWGLYNANTGSMLNCISIVLSAGFMLRYRGKISNYVLNGINILIQLTCLVLTGSRAAFYALIGILVVGTCFLNLRMYLRKYEKISLKCVLTGVMAVCCYSGGFYRHNRADESADFICPQRDGKPDGSCFRRFGR